jgi:hypothetical protein
MNYYIEKHDMEMVVDALEFMVETMKTREIFGLPNIWPYSKEDVDILCQSFDNSGAETNV